MRGVERMKPKFNIGDVVYSKVRRRGCAEPSYCHIGEMFTIKSVTQCGNHFVYTCGYDCYEFHEDELMTADEYVEKIKNSNVV